MKKNKQEFEKWATKIALKYMKKLDMSLMEVEVTNDNDIDFFEVANRYPYKDIVYITYSDYAFEKWCDGDVSEFVIVHEICHMLTDPLFCKARQRFVSETEINDERESLTDKIMTIIRAYENKIK